MTRAKRSPADELAEVDARISALDREREDVSAQQGDAEALLRTFPERRETAMMLGKLGEQVELPDEAEQARLTQLVANAKVEHDAIARARRQREEERTKIIAAGLPFFDDRAEEAARAYVASGEALLVATVNFQAAGQTKDGAWRHSRAGRKELGRDLPPGVGFHDVGHLQREVADAMRCAWPANSEKAWREFKAREQAGSAGATAPRQPAGEALLP